MKSIPRSGEYVGEKMRVSGGEHLLCIMAGSRCYYLWDWKKEYDQRMKNGLFIYMLRVCVCERKHDILISFCIGKESMTC